MSPNDTIDIGSAIAEIDNDIHFSEIHILTKNDTISARGISEIKSLFNKNFIDRLEKPYLISVE